MNIIDLDFIKNMKMSHFMSGAIATLTMIAPVAALMYVYDREFMVNNNFMIVLTMLLGLGMLSYLVTVSMILISSIFNRKSIPINANQFPFVLILASFAHTMSFSLFIFLLQAWPLLKRLVNEKLIFDNLNDFISVYFYFLFVNFCFMAFFVFIHFSIFLVSLSRKESIEKN